MLIHGRNTVHEALKLGLVKHLYLRKNSTFDVSAYNVDITEYGRKEFEHFYGRETQGVAAEVDEIVPEFFNDNVEEICANGPAVILDRIFDPHNFGAIIRACHCFGVKTIIIGVDKQAPVTAAVCKASSGTLFYTDIYTTLNISTAGKILQESGYKLFCADANGDTPLSEAEFPFKSALVMGSEGKGVRPGLLNKADTVVSIPMKGNIDSLNVSQSASVILYEMCKSL